MSILDAKCELTIGDLYNITLGITNPNTRLGPVLEKLLVNALKSIEMDKYPSDIKERVKSLLNEYYGDCNEEPYILDEPHPLWPAAQTLYVSVGQNISYAYFLIPKSDEHT